MNAGFLPLTGAGAGPEFRLFPPGKGTEVSAAPFPELSVARVNASRAACPSTANETDDAEPNESPEEDALPKDTSETWLMASLVASSDADPSDDRAPSSDTSKVTSQSTSRPPASNTARACEDFGAAFSLDAFGFFKRREGSTEISVEPLAPDEEVVAASARFKRSFSWNNESCDSRVISS
jgi:hypothetical protein|tara:strand:+ start:6703 stop:7245 length:543 start_codon:yes stop_codon:yes gene_type:complete